MLQIQIIVSYLYLLFTLLQTLLLSIFYYVTMYVLLLFKFLSEGRDSRLMSFYKPLKHLIMTRNVTRLLETIFRQQTKVRRNLALHSHLWLPFMVFSFIYICDLQIHLSLKKLYGLHHDCTDHCGISLPHIVAYMFFK